MNKIESTTQKWIQKGRHIWVKAKANIPNPSEDAFLEAIVVGINGKQVMVSIVSQNVEGVQMNHNSQEALLNEYKVGMDDCLKLTYSSNDVADMVDLEELNEPELLFNTKRRYLQDSIFTYCGPTLVIINPYTFIEKLFNDTVLMEYQTYVFSDTLEYKNLSPHIFSLGAFCLWQLFENQRNQSIVISGQSGAGKTQNTKYCLKFLASLGKNMRQLMNKPESKKSMPNHLIKSFIKKSSLKLQGIEDKILGCNEILEAFGNSKTIRNDNSSRFGKLILLIYGETQVDIKSAYIISYLLEKSRIVSLSEGERNYHVFYYFLCGLTEEEKVFYKITEKKQNYYYLNQSTVYTVKGVSDSKRFQELKQQFKMYISSQEIQCIFKILAITLNMGNLLFEKKQNKNNQEIATIVNPIFLKNVAELLSVNYQQFQQSFQFKTRKVGGSVLKNPLRYLEAIALKDSFCKNIYEKVFNFLVVKLNQKIELEKVDINQNGSAKVYRKSIGLLDIFGFEVLGINSLEQFFINFANEKLQQLYVSYIFKEQQNEFLREGLKQFSHDIGFQDNKPIIDLFEQYPLGIFHLINESSELNKSDDILPDAIQKNHNKNVFIQIPKSKKCVFLINHSCSPVTYNTNGFTSRNKDQFPQQLLDIISNSTNLEMKKIIYGESNKEESKNRTASKKFLGSKFLNEMNKLTEELYSCDCHFVRCIKPNSSKSPKLFNSEAVLQSLRYLGVLDSIIIRKLGYIYRRPFKEFVKKFYQLDSYIFSFSKFVQDKTQEEFKEQSKKIVIKYIPKEFQEKFILIGHKKILIKESALNHLESLLKERRKFRIQSANKINHMYKSSVFRGQVKTFLSKIYVLKVQMKSLVEKIREKIKIKKIIKVQKAINKFLFQKRLEKIKQQATKSVNTITSIYKMRKQRKIFLETKKKILKIQSNIRFFLKMGHFIRLKFCETVIEQVIQKSWHKVQEANAIKIQKVYKGYITRLKYKKAFEQIKRKLNLVKYRQKLTRVYSRIKYKRFKDKIDLYKKPILMLQSLVKMRYARKVYLKMKKSAILIQKAFRSHLRKKYYLIRLWRQYRKKIYVDEQLKFKDLNQLTIFNEEYRQFIEKMKISKNYSQTLGIKLQMNPQEMMKKYLKNPNSTGRKAKLQSLYLEENQQQKRCQSHLLNEQIHFEDKNTFQLYIADYDILSSKNTSGKWLKSYNQLKQTIKHRNQYPIYAKISDNFTIVLTNKDKMHQFQHQHQTQRQGRGHFSQEEPFARRDELRSEVYSMNNIPKSISVADKGGYLFNSENKMYIWEEPSLYNDKVEKEEQHQKISAQFLSFSQPIKMSPQQSKIQLTDVKIKGINKYFLDKEGKHYEVSQNESDVDVDLKKENQFEKINKSVDKSMLGKMQIIQIAASYFFVHFLTSVGTVFSKGSNSKGELGLGHISKQINTPTLNLILKNNLKQIIQTVSCGIGHSLAKSKLGYVYAWGDNCYHQVKMGMGKQFYECPIQIEIEETIKLKAYQAVAGARCSYFLTQSLKTYGQGVSSSTFSANERSFPYALELLKSTCMNKHLIDMKLTAEWNYQHSVLFVNCIDSSKCKAGTKLDVINKYVKIIAKEWQDNTIYPNYHQWCDNILQLSDLRKLKFSGAYKQATSTVHPQKSTNSNSELEELQLLINLRKTSPLFKNAARTKIQQKMKELNGKEKQEWTVEDVNIYEFIQNNIKPIYQ